MDNSGRTPSPSSGDKKQPLNGSTSQTTRTTSLNDRLNTSYIDVGPGNNSLCAKLTRTITGFVGNFVSPRRLLVVLRVLKAITFCFLVLTIAADLMYITFLEILAPKEIRNLVGGARDTIIRIYGLLLAIIAILIELDFAEIMKAFAGLKGFIPRSLLLFLIASITGSHPLNTNEVASTRDDDLFDYLVDDEYVNFSSDIPDSAVVFQMVTSFILGLCAFTYFLFGILCLDRFTSKAFLSTNDPLVTTAIPVPSAVQPMDDDMGIYQTAP